MSQQLPEQLMTFKSFAGWCLNKDRLSTEARHTVEVLLKCAGTSECHEAERILSSLTKLKLLYKLISDLSPLQTLTNLTSVDLQRNQISDLSPLQTLTNLTSLDLFENQISDLSPLQTLTNLTSLSLGRNQISDLSPLQTLTNLTFVELFDNQISDPSPLQTLTNLTSLDLTSNQISDLSSLQTLTNLTSLRLYRNQISDLSPLQILTNLTSVSLSDNQISDPSPLQTLTNLTSIELYNNQISDLSPLQILTNLTSVSLGRNQISDLASLQTLTNLSFLSLSDNQISDLAPLQTLTNLTSLSLESNQISDLAPLQTLTNLTFLSLESNQISDLSPLQTLTNLASLHLESNQISDLSPLQTLTNLTSLSLSDNQVSDLSPLQTLTNLTSLELYNNQITDLAPLQTLTNLTSLELYNNQITDQSSPLQLLRQEWLSITLSTNPIDRQKAIQAIEYTYTVLGQEEPDIIFFHSLDAAMAWCSEDEDQQLGASLRGQLFQSKKSILEKHLDWRLRSQPDREFERGLVKWDADQDYYPGGSPIVTPADLADVLSITQLLVSHSGRVLEAKEQEVLRCLHQLAEHCGWLFLFEKGCLVCDRPTKLSFDNQQRLHAEGEPAIEFADESSLYSYHGVILPEKYGKLHPNQWQAQWLLEENNAELRRVLIQGIGYARICQELQVTELDSWTEYTLLKIDNDADVEPIYLLKMTCPSTGFIHALRVPPNIQSAREAIRWVNWGTDPEEFSVQS